MKARLTSLNNLGFVFNHDFIVNVSQTDQKVMTQITVQEHGETLSEVKNRFLSYLGITDSPPVKAKRSRDDPSSENQVNKRARTSIESIVSMDEEVEDEATMKILNDINANE
jgi:hypothetical protein